MRDLAGRAVEYMIDFWDTFYMIDKIHDRSMTDPSGRAVGMGCWDT